MADAVNLSFVMSERAHLAALFLGLCIQLPLSSLSGVIQSMHGPDPGGHQLACSHGGCIPELAHHRAATHQTMARNYRGKLRSLYVPHVQPTLGTFGERFGIFEVIQASIEHPR